MALVGIRLFTRTFSYPPYWPLQTLGFSERLSGELAPLASLTSLQKIVLALCQFS
jgi:hypothetical protein